MENRLGSNQPNRKLEFPERTSDSLTLGRDATCCLNWAINGSETQIIKTAKRLVRFIFNDLRILVVFLTMIPKSTLIVKLAPAFPE